MALQPGDRFGRYELVSWLGRGGMAETWRARLVGDAGVTKPVLIKKVLPEYANDEAFISMFISEARISASLSHGNVAQVFDFGRVDGEYFLAMEFVDGQPLNRLMKRALKEGLTALPIPLATYIALEMCRGLHYAHTRTDSKGAPLGLVHRDISPDNVLISYEGQVKIVDFGIAKARSLRTFKTEPGVVKGKYLFFSPEQARGREVDARTDVWATGVVLYEMLCGQLPVVGQAHTVMMRLARGEFPTPRQVRKELPAELDELVMRALSVDLGARYESSHAFADALAGFLYSFAPRFSSMNLAHLVRELFRGDLAHEGREMAVPPSFLEELQVWRSMSTAPNQPAPSSQRTRNESPAQVAPATTRKLGPPTPPVATDAGPQQSRGRGWAVGAGGLLVLGCAAMLGLPALTAPEAHNPSPLQPLERTAELKPPPVAPPSPEGAPAPGPQVRPEGPAGATVQAEVEWLLGAARRVSGSSPSRVLEFTARCLELVPGQPDCVQLSESARTRLRESEAAKKPEEENQAVKKTSGSDRELARMHRQLAGGTAAPKPDTENFEFLAEGARKLVRLRQYPEAASLAERCLAMVPDHLECLLLSGTALARLRRVDEAARHYRRFLEVAPPGHPRYRMVKQLVASYDQARPGAPQRPRRAFKDSRHPKDEPN